MTQGASRRQRGAGWQLGSTSGKSQPPNGDAAPVPPPRPPGLHPRTPEHPLAVAWVPFCEPSAPPSVPKFFLGFLFVHLRHFCTPETCLAVPRDGWSPRPGQQQHPTTLVPASTRTPPTQLLPLFSHLTPQIPCASSQVGRLLPQNPTAASHSPPKAFSFVGEDLQSRLKCFTIQGRFCRAWGDAGLQRIRAVFLC